MKKPIHYDFYRLTGFEPTVIGYIKALWNPGFRYLFFFRLIQSSNSKIIINFLKLILRHYQFKFGYQIHPSTKIGKGFYIGHFGSIIINSNAVIGENCNKDERKEYLLSLSKVTTGDIRAEDVDESEFENFSPIVRLVNGSTKQDTRQTLMLTFNTPFFPEILVASSVMSEGVDLQLNCRHIIHHDLCWNPSTLEQRTGRIDRIGAKAELCGQSINVFLPYVAETQDEKMYRVVMDRERWFNIVMGEKFKVDTSNTDKLAERIILPNKIIDELQFKLEC